MKNSEINKSKTENINEKKAIIRKEIKTFFSSDKGKEIISNAKALQTSEDYCKAFLNKIPEYKFAKTIFAYYPLPPEFPTLGLLKQADKDGKTIAIPLVDNKDLIFKQVKFLDGNLSPVQKGSFGVFEPTEEAKIIFPGGVSSNKGVPNGELEFPLIVLVPGRAFSNDGKRLGWGGGFYDRFLQKLFAKYSKPIRLVGLCFSEQICDDIPCEEFDCKVDLVLTEKLS